LRGLAGFLAGKVAGPTSARILSMKHTFTILITSIAMAVLTWNWSRSAPLQTGGARP